MVAFEESNVLYFLEYKTHYPPPKFGRKLGVANLARWGVRGWWWSGSQGRSRVAAAGSWRQQEWGDAVGPGLGGGGVPVVDAREAGAESPLQHTIVLGRRVQGVQAR